jgi:hypothetical protein
MYVKKHKDVENDSQELKVKMREQKVNNKEEWAYVIKEA